MKLIDILETKESILKLNKVKFSDFKIVSEVFKLIKKIDNTLEIIHQEQEKIIDMYVLKDEKGELVIKDNQYQFSSDENKMNFIKEMEQLKFSDVDDIEKIDIPFEKIQNANDLTSEEMLKLEKFINWIY